MLPLVWLSHGDALKFKSNGTGTWGSTVIQGAPLSSCWQKKRGKALNVSAPKPQAPFPAEPRLLHSALLFLLPTAKFTFSRENRSSGTGAHNNYACIFI